MLQDSTEDESSSSSSSKRGRYEYRDGSGPSSGQPPPSYSAQRVSFLTGHDKWMFKAVGAVFT